MQWKYRSYLCEHFDSTLKRLGYSSSALLSGVSGALLLPMLLTLQCCGTDRSVYHIRSVPGKLVDGLISDLTMNRRARSLGHLLAPEYHLWSFYRGFMTTIVGQIVVFIQLSYIRKHIVFRRSLALAFQLLLVRS